MLSFPYDVIGVGYHDLSHTESVGQYMLSSQDTHEIDEMYAVRSIGFKWVLKTVE